MGNSEKVDSHSSTQNDKLIETILQAFLGSRVLTEAEALPFKGIFSSHKSSPAKKVEPVEKPVKRCAEVVQENLSLFSSLDHNSGASRQRETDREREKRREGNGLR